VFALPSGLSIRKVSKKEDFINGGTATAEMLDFLAECLRYGISVCVAGATSSGKTTVAGWLLTTIPDSKRIFTIENGSRELALVRKRDGKIVNSVIHTLTRSSENEKQNIDQDMLLDMALRFNPEVICVGEMRSSEAYAAQEAARTGHTVLTTIHSNSCEATWRRMVTLCKRKYDMADDTLMSLVTEAFPIVVFTKQLEDKKRRMMEIMECEILPDGQRNFRTLFQFQIAETAWRTANSSLRDSTGRLWAFPQACKSASWKTACPRRCWRKSRKEVWPDDHASTHGLRRPDCWRLYSAWAVARRIHRRPVRLSNQAPQGHPG